MLWTYSPIPDEWGHVTGFVGVGRDITEWSELDAQLHQSAKLASLGVMAGGLAHEIRNALSGALPAAQLLLQQSCTDQNPRCLECAGRIAAGVKRASGVIENLLTFARDTGSAFEPVDVEEALVATLPLVDRLSQNAHVTIETHLEPRLPSVSGNAGELQQVFVNLMLNAVHAMPDGGTLALRTHRREVSTKHTPRSSSRRWEVCVEFSDTGVGIPGEVLPRIFDPFFTTQPTEKATGLGLSIAYRLIQHHRGRIEVETEVGSGSTFTVVLPVSAGRRKSSQSKGEKGVNYPRGGAAPCLGCR